LRRSHDRPSSLGIEVRKDLVCNFDRHSGRPTPTTDAQLEQAAFIGRTIAGAIATYFETDRQFL
jgi:hypothetical protein